MSYRQNLGVVPSLEREPRQGDVQHSTAQYKAPGHCGARLVVEVEHHRLHPGVVRVAGVVHIAAVHLPLIITSFVLRLSSNDLDAVVKELGDHVGQLGGLLLGSAGAVQRLLTELPPE